MRNNSHDAAKAYSVDDGFEVDAVLGGWMSRVGEMLARPFVWMVNIVSGWGLTLKVRLFLIIFFIFPALTSLVMLEAYPNQLCMALAFALVAAIVGLVPLANLVKYLLIEKDLKEIDAFCRRLKEGDYGHSFNLPAETDDEHRVIALKRNLNWMAHVISHRESRLHAALEGAHEDKNHFESLSNLDPLTGLANRRFLEQRLEELVGQTMITKLPLSIIFIDCDRFKSVNDSFGHQAGDLLLRCLGDIISRNVRKHVDIPFRYGGDEFGVVCVGLTPGQAVNPAERIRKEFLQHRLGMTTLSVGVAGCLAQGSKNHDDIVAKFIKAADEAAYRAKVQGGNQVVVDREEK